MRKLFALYLSVMYLMLSMGFSQYLHLCMSTDLQQYAVNSVALSSDEPCPICTSVEQGLTQQKDNCCKHEIAQLKTDEVASQSSVFDFALKLWGESIPNRMLGALFDPRALEIAEQQLYTNLSTSTSLGRNPLYILHCVYRI